MAAPRSSIYFLVQTKIVWFIWTWARALSGLPSVLLLPSLTLRRAAIELFIRSRLKIGKDVTYCRPHHATSVTRQRSFYFNIWSHCSLLVESTNHMNQALSMTLHSRNLRVDHCCCITAMVKIPNLITALRSILKNECPPLLRGFICAYHPAAPGSNPKQTIYTFSI